MGQDGRPNTSKCNTMRGSSADRNGPRALLTVDGLTKRFPVGGGLFRKPSSFIHAVDDVSFRLERRGSLGLVGESGCGKTTVGKLLVKLLEPTEGEIWFRFPQAITGGADGGGGDGAVDASAIRGRQLRAFRRQAQMIFQDPYESMNPRRTIYDTIAEPLAVQGSGPPAGPRGPGFGDTDAGGARRRRRPSCSGIPTSFRADSGSASPSPAPW